ncbi:MAG: hypothetical protein FWF15_01755 [Oscillospiraceae bacterium]|nr:hypothetical protein [Oscillospiraceae bacterium]
MKNLTKIIIAFLVFALSVIIISCASSEQNTPNANETQSGSENPAETTTEILKPDIPEVDYNGDTFMFIVHDYGAGATWDSYDIYADEENGDAINDAIYRKNRTVEEKLNINIKEFRILDPISALTKSVLSDDPEYDCAQIGADSAAQMANKGYLLFFDQLPYVDLSKPWWDQSVNPYMSLGNNQFSVMGDLTLLDKDGTVVVLFNKKMAENYEMENFYDLVKNNKWTMDKYYSLMKMVATDVNGDGRIGFDEIAGLVGAPYVGFYFFTTGETFVEKDKDDFPSLKSPTERGVKVIEKIVGFMNDKNVSTIAQDLTKDGIPAANVYEDGVYKMFQEDRALFLYNQLIVLRFIRGMDNDFGILPAPKFDETQPKYNSMMTWISRAIAVPVTVRDRIKTSVIIEALAAEGKYTIIPAYYETTILNKAIRDEESADMLDIVFASRILDTGTVYNWGGIGLMVDELLNNPNGFVAKFDSISQKVATEMEKTIEAFKELES